MSVDEEFISEGQLENLQKKGISDDGIEINPEYMTDEDVLLNFEVKREITIPVTVRVHKDHKSHFDMMSYFYSDELDEYLSECSDDFIENSEEFYRFVGVEEENDHFLHYICCDGTFYKPFSETDYEHFSELLN